MSLHKWAAALMLVLWLPATSLCFAEQAGWLRGDNCCPVNTCKVPASNPTCCVLASANYKLNEAGVELAVPEEPGSACIAFAPDVRWISHLVFAEFASPAEGFSVRWQFVERTALLPRAPAILV